MDSDELLDTIRNTSMQMSIDFITKGTTPDNLVNCVIELLILHGYFTEN